MGFEDFPPVNVVPFTQDFLINYIRFKTGWTRRSGIAIKQQLTYLYKYLEKDHIGAKTIVVENEYIDRNYLEDYAEYYARCFSQHQRFCARIHFFRSTFNESEFIEKTSENCADFLESLATNYLGFVVIRPIPETFLAKACLIPYRELSVNNNYRVLTNTHTVSMFGINLHVDSAAFIEQDKVVSACATSALWVLLNLNERMGLNCQPSPSSITKAAINGYHENSKTFPSSGLTMPQIERALRHFDLEPTTIDDSITHIDSKILKEVSFGYINQGIPLLVGGKVYRKLPPPDSGDEEAGSSDIHGVEEVGPHVICCLGYKLAGKSNGAHSGARLLSHSIDRFYVHDDRLGFYARMLAEPVLLPVEKGSHYGFEYGIEGGEPEYFEPEFLIVGAYHKIRLPYILIANICSAWNKMLRVLVPVIKVFTDEDQEADDSSGFTLRDLMNEQYAIQLTTNNDLKSGIRECSDFFSFNGSTDKGALLFQSFPRYLWTIVVSDVETGERLYQLIFDATEVPQGRVLIGYISFTAKYENLLKIVEKLCKENLVETYVRLGPEDLANLGPIIKLFEEDRGLAYLNTMYGPLGLPVRSLKDGEYDDHLNHVRRPDVITFRRGSSDYIEEYLDPTVTYIWVIDEAGDLVIGPDINNSSGVGVAISKGHPTLMDGKPGRIAGELKYDADNEIWVINSKSGAYSVHLFEKVSDRKHYRVFPNCSG